MNFANFMVDRFIAALVFFLICLIVWGALVLAGVKFPELKKPRHLWRGSHHPFASFAPLRELLPSPS